MANVMFKRGLSSALGNLTLKDGTFYLTTDTDKLYVAMQGKDDTAVRLHALNQNIHTVTNLATLKSPGVQDYKSNGDFYYCINENVLAYWNGTDWIQINPDTDTKVTDVTTTTSVADKTATFKTTVTLSNGSTPEGSFVIKGAGGITLSKEGNVVVITSANDNATYTLGTTENADKGTITLTGTGTDAETTNISIEGTNGIAIKSDASGKITVDGKTLNDKISTLETDTTVNNVKNTFDANGNFTTAITEGSKAAVTSNAVTPKVKLDTTATASANGEYVFASGMMSLPVYTSKEVDDKIEKYFQDANAMVYRGYLDATHALPTADIQCGWTYKVAEKGTYAGHECNVGDLLIANKDATTGSDIIWDRIPSCDEKVITGKAEANKVSVLEGGVEIAGVTVASGDMITVSGAANGTTTTFTVNHDKVSGELTKGSTTDITQEEKSTAEFSAITEITRDAYGHITGTSTKKITVVDTHNDISGVTVKTTHSDDGATVKLGVTTNDSPSGQTADLKLTSDNLTITNGTQSGSTQSDTIKIDFVWGSF